MASTTAFAPAHILDSSPSFIIDTKPPDQGAHADDDAGALGDPGVFSTREAFQQIRHMDSMVIDSIPFNEVKSPTNAAHAHPDEVVNEQLSYLMVTNRWESSEAKEDLGWDAPSNNLMDQPLLQSSHQCAALHPRGHRGGRHVRYR